MRAWSGYRAKNTPEKRNRRRNLDPILYPMGPAATRRNVRVWLPFCNKYLGFQASIARDWGIVTFKRLHGLMFWSVLGAA